MMLVLAGGLAAGAEAQPGQAQALSATIAQQITLPNLKIRSAYSGVFQDSGMARLEGEVFAPALTGKADAPIKMTMVANGRWVKQLADIDGLVQFVTYDLEQIRREFPGAELAQDLDPRCFGRAVAESREKALVREEAVSGEPTKVYELPVAGVFASLPMPGVATPLPRPKRVLVWVAGDGLPRKLEAEDVKGRVFLTTTFMNVKQVDEAPASVFDLKAPKEALELDMTDMVLEVFRGQKAEESRKATAR